MRRRWILNLLLLILVAALSTAVRQDLELELEVPTLTGLTPGDIAEVVLERPEAPAIRITRSPEDWRMEAPYKAEADGTRMDQLMRIASTPIHRTLPYAAGHQQLGLDPPGVRLTLDGLELRFGDLDPVDQRRYVAIGDQVYLIDDGFQHHLIASPEDYVDRRLLPAGFSPQTGTLDGEPLEAEALEELAGVRAERVEALGEEISGRLLSLESGKGGPTLRFLVTEDARLWSRLDLRLSYLVAQPPFWALGEDLSKQPPPTSESPIQSE